MAKATQIIPLAACALLHIVPAQAFDDPGSEPGRYLSGYEPSYFTPFAIDDIDTHLEFSLSLKYPLDSRKRWYFTYTGMYDFFVYSNDIPERASGPIVSRLQNPGIFYKYFPYRSELADAIKLQNISGDADQPAWRFTSIAIGWFHESNGQQVEGSDNTTTLSPVEIDADFVSRGWDYLGLDLHLQYDDNPLTFSHFNLYARFRLFCDCQGLGAFGSREDDTTIFTGADNNDISSFDGLRLILDHDLSREISYGVQLRTGFIGDDPLENWSVRAELTVRKLANIPLNIFYFNGYGVNISTYHYRDSYVGIGFKMW